MARIYERGGKWWIDFRDAEGKRVRQSTGLVDEQVAQGLAAEVDAVLAGQERVDQCMEVLRRAGALSIQDWRLPIQGLWEFFVAHAMNRQGAATEKERRGKVAAFVGWLEDVHPEVRYVHEVTVRVCHQFLVGKMEEGAAPSTVNNWIGRLKPVWDQIRVPAGLGENPWSAVQRSRGKGTSFQPISLGQYDKMLQVADGWVDSLLDPGFWSCALRMAVVTGLRAGDIAGLRWEKLRDEGDYLVLLPAKVEHYGDAHVTVHRKDAGWGQFLPEAKDEGFVWPKAATRFGRATLGREFKELAEKIGLQVERAPLPGERRKQVVKLVTFHSLRKVFATELLRRKGVSPEDLVDQGGWSSVGVLEGHYNFAKLERAKSAADKVADAWGEILRTG